MLYLIGLGLNSKSISVEALEIIKSSDKVFLENYTSILECSKEELEEFYGKKIVLADRNLVESKAEEILDGAKTKNVCFLVVGDIFSATTHHDLWVRAKKEGIKIKVFHNASIINAVSSTGLDIYKFGKTTSIVFPDDNWFPKTPYDVIKDNSSLGLHTLCLLDIKVSEPSKTDLLKGINKPQPPRFMTIKEAIDVLFILEENHKEKVVTKESLAFGVARLGLDDQIIICGTLEKLRSHDFGKPLHSLIIIGKLNEVEKEAISFFK
ncbi:MAG: diphthine synthase [Candidatus Woesearchaeota archaeon]